MTPIKWAGIGAKKTPADILSVMEKIGFLLAKTGHICCTGACTGADQNFANGAIKGGGIVHLSLPWWKYELDWRNTLPPQQIVCTTYDERLDQNAANSVRQFHPAVDKLSQGVFKLHARNYLIIDPVSFIVCWTPGGEIVGGTGQGLRLAASRNIQVYNLGVQSVLDAFLHDIDRRQAEFG